MGFLIPKEEILWVQYTENDVVKYFITSNLYRTEYYLYKIVNSNPKKTKYTSDEPCSLEKYIKWSKEE